MNDIMKVSSKFAHLGRAPRLGQGVSSGFTWIGMKGQKFHLKHQGETKTFVDANGMPLQYLDCVILGMNEKISKVWYNGVYSEGSTNPPDCQSLDGEAPLPNVPMPQSKSCHTCKQNAWGSAPNGGRGKACQDHRRLAILLWPTMTANILDKPLVEPIFFKVPPNSLKALKTYDNSLDARGIAHWTSVITRITFVPNRMFELHFDVLKPVADSDADVVLAVMDDPQTKAIVGGMVEIDEAPAIPPPEEDEAAETGIPAAFRKADTPVAAAPAPAAVTAPRPRGRPPGSTNKPKTIEAKAIPQEEPGTNWGKGAARQQPVEEAVPQQAPQEEEQGSSWGEEVASEADGQVNDKVRTLLEDHKAKLDRMMK